MRALALAAAALLAACATPVAPTGGPPDRTPPRLVASTPAADEVNVRTDRLLLEFSKPVDENSLRRAFAVVPDLPRPPRITVRGRRAEIRFEEPLREATTYVVTIGTELQDLRTNRLPAPITLAFATGPQLDRGRLEGTVRHPETGAGVADLWIFAYALPPGADALPEETLRAALPDPRTALPDYRTQTDQQGRFRLDYLRDAPFFVVAVDDRNRNRRADPGEAFAVPRRPALRPAAPEAPEPPRPLELFVTRLDTVPPEPLRVRNLSNRRFALRFTEAVVLAERDPAAFVLTDSLAAQRVPIETVYADNDPFQLVLRTAPMATRPHRLELVRPSAVTDSAGNPARPRPLSFTPSTAEDTLRLRLVETTPTGRGLLPGETVTLRFSETPPPEAFTDRLAVTDPDGVPLGFTVTTRDGVRFRLEPDTPGPFTVRFREADTTRTRTFRPMPADSLGELTGRVEPVPDDAPVVVEARREDLPTVRTTAAADGTFVLEGLPEGEVRLRAFEDRDGSGRWFGGQLAPFRPPEPMAVPPPVRVRARWETELDPIRLDEPGAPLPPEPPPQPDEPPPQPDEPPPQPDEPPPQPGAPPPQPGAPPAPNGDPS